MLQFAWPWLLVLLPLPLLVRRLPPLVRRQSALRVPFIQDFFQQEPASNARYRDRLPLVFAALAWIALLLAASRPQWLGDPLPMPLQGRDLMLAIDLSESMKEQDFQLGQRWVDRLTATKAVAGSFIDKREGDRIGLILFGERAYLQAPLTFDRTTVRRLLDEALINIAGPRTAIGDAIGLAVKRFRDKPGDKVLILLSDGKNTAGAVDPVKAAELAASERLKIYTIGIGSDSGGGSFFGMRIAGGSSGLDERSLKRIAQLTGGQYFRARDTRSLGQVYAQIDKLEPVESEQHHFRPMHALFYWPLAVSLLLAGLAIVRQGRSTAG